MTKFEKIKQMDIDEFAEYLVNIGWDCNFCSEHERLDNEPLLREEKCDEHCVKHCLEWLKMTTKK